MKMNEMKMKRKREDDDLFSSFYENLILLNSLKSQYIENE